MASKGTTRRRLLARAPFAAAATALAASYGTLLATFARFLYPAADRKVEWMYLARVASLPAGSSLVYKTPAGETVNVARRGASGAAADFVALSSVCPHLGCQVHWESQNSRFFCPCHNGAFAPDGTATEGPPAEAGQSLPTYPLKVEDGLLYIEVPLEGLPLGDARRADAGTDGESRCA